MRVGFTGTRHGMSRLQIDLFAAWVCGRVIGYFHHGCCIGADTDAVVIVSEKCRPPVTIIGHPGDWGPMTSKEAASRSAEMLPCKRNLDRNRDIVNACDLLVACPKDATEQPRGGTWHTIRYARQVRKPVVLILPDGTIG